MAVCRLARVFTVRYALRMKGKVSIYHGCQVWLAKNVRKAELCAELQRTKNRN